MKNVIICGTGEFAREVYYWIKSSGSKYNLKGFLGIDGESLKKHNLYQYYLGIEDNYIFLDDDYTVIAIADVVIRKSLYLKLKKQNAKFINYTHPSVIIGSEIDIGEANIICPNSIFTTNISIGNANIFNMMVTVGHDVVIGNYNTFGPHVDINGNVLIGHNNLIGGRVSLTPKSCVRDDSKISAGSVLYGTAKSGALMIGNPAKKMLLPT